jgi:hypothetical protein
LALASYLVFAIAMFAAGEHRYSNFATEGVNIASAVSQRSPRLYLSSSIASRSSRAGVISRRFSNPAWFP